MTLLKKRRLELAIGLELALLLITVLPLLDGWRREQRARYLAGRLEIIESAAVTQYLRDGAWPEGASPGSAPASMKRFLPRGFSFVEGEGKLAWDYWELEDERRPVGAEFKGVSVTERDPRVLDRVVEILGARRMHFTVGNRATFVVETPAGLVAPATRS